MALEHVLQTRGWQGLWCGLVPTLLRVGVGMGVYFFCLNQLGAGPRDRAKRQKSSSFLLFSSGFVSRSVAALLVQPLTVIKTRFEAGDRAYGKGALRNLIGIARKERMKGLFRGVIPTVMRDAPFSGIYLLLYTNLTRLLSAPSSPLPSDTPRSAFQGLLAGTYPPTHTHNDTNTPTSHTPYRYYCPPRTHIHPHTHTFSFEPRGTPSNTTTTAPRTRTRARAHAHLGLPCLVIP